MMAINPDFLPHSGDMLLLAGVLQHDTTAITCVSHVLTQECPLAFGGQIASLNIIEYAAQAAAVHQGLHYASSTGSSPSRAGVLATVRNVYFAFEVLPLNYPLRVQASCRAQSAQGCSYRFVALSEGATMGSGELIIAFQDTTQWHKT